MIEKPVSVAICMGSSCFSRGNNRNIEILQNCIANCDPKSAVELRGHLCEGMCKQGPNIQIGEKLYHEVDPVMLVGLLTQQLGRRQF